MTAFRVPRPDLVRFSVLPPFSETKPNIAGAFEPPLSRHGVYQAIRTGRIPSVRVGARLYVPVERFRVEVLGEGPLPTEGQTPRGNAAGQAPADAGAHVEAHETGVVRVIGRRST